jgi:hypothetical protein
VGENEHCHVHGPGHDGRGSLLKHAKNYGKNFVQNYAKQSVSKHAEIEKLNG